MVGAMSFFADLTNEGSRSIVGQYLGLLCAPDDRGAAPGARRELADCMWLAGTSSSPRTGPAPAVQPGEITASANPRTGWD
jgi:hypothetical protein